MKRKRIQVDEGKKEYAVAHMCWLLWLPACDAVKLNERTAIFQVVGKHAK